MSSDLKIVVLPIRGVPAAKIWLPHDRQVQGLEARGGRVTVTSHEPSAVRSPSGVCPMCRTCRFVCTGGSS